MNVLYRSLIVCCIAAALVGCEAEKQLRLARAADLAGRPAAAERHYRLALEANPQLAEDPHFAAALSRAQAQALHEDGRRLASQNNWKQAISQYQAAIEADRDYQPARDDLAQAGPAAAAWHLAEASDLERENRLNEAIRHLEQAVSFQAQHPIATRELDRLLTLRRERREKAESLLVDSRRLAAEKQWDQAIAAAKNASRLVPTDKTYPDQANSIKQAAARHWTAQGAALLDQNKLGQAESSFNSAFRYVANHTPARRGLGDTDFQRGQAAQQQNLHGRALLWYRRAADHIQDQRYTAALNAARVRILRTHLIDVQVRGGSDDAALVSSVIAGFQRSRPDYVRLVGTNSKSTADYVFDIDLARLEIREKLLRDRRANHPYEEYHDIANPKLPHLRAALRDAERDLDRLIHRSDEHCHVCHGKGKIRCADCQNRSHRQCSTCKGSGKRYRVSRAEIHRHKCIVDDLRRELATAPELIRQVIHKQWAYTIHDYEKSGDLETVISLSDANAGRMLDTQLVRRHFAAKDSAVSGANPAIGLAQDPLTLPSDDTVRTELISGGAGEVAKRLMLMTARQRHAALQAEASRQKGKTALELRVAAALMLEPAEPNRAKQLLDQLR